MVFIIDEKGTTQLVQTSPIYQGSSGVNDVILFAPFPANYRILISCILPNGLPLRDVYPMEAVVMPVMLENVNKQRYTCFRAVVNEMLTGIAGNVEIQFRVLQGVTVVNGQAKPNVLATYKTAFNVGEGVPVDPLYTPTAGDDIETILAYLTSLTGDFLKLIYYATDAYSLINNSFDNNASISVIPEGYNDYITDYNPFTPQEMNNDDDKVFLALYDNTDNAGFVVDIGKTVDIAVVQMFVTSAITDIVATITTSENGITYGNPSTMVINATVQPQAVVVRSYINDENIKFVKITFDKDISIERVQFFSPTYNGQYIFEFASGTKSVVNFSELVEVLRSEIFQGLTSISQEAASAKETAETATTTANNALSLADTAYSKAIDATTTANNALANSSTALASVPKTYFENTFQYLVLACLTNTAIKPGDLLINLSKTQIDFLVFSASPPAFPLVDSEGNPYRTLTYQDATSFVNGGLPIPEVGDIFLIENVNPSTGANIGSPRIGIIALEGGFASPGYAVDDALSTTSTNPVANWVIAEALGDVESVLEAIISQQNSYINGGVPNGN